MQYFRGSMLVFHLPRCRQSLCWIGYIGSRRWSKIQSKKTHQHHHPKMEDGSPQQKPVMVDPRNIPTYDLSAQAMQRKSLFFFSFGFSDWMFYFEGLVS